MVEGDNSSGGTDKDEDIYCTIITGLIMFVLPLMVFKFLRAPSSNHPLVSHFFCLLCFPLSSRLPPHTPFSQYVAHSCFSLKTVLLINWWLHTCNKSHDSRWTIHLLLWNGSDTTSALGGSRQDSGHPGTVQLSLSPRWLWLLFADDRLWWRIMFLAAVVKGGFNCMGENSWVAKEILLDNCFTVKWSVRICSETTTIVPEVKIQHHIVHYYADRQRERVKERTLHKKSVHF